MSCLSDFYFTSESVRAGHPDKLCDLIADAILSEFLLHDKDARVACEVVCCSGLVLITGEVSSDVCLNLESLTRAVIKEVGYCDCSLGLDYKTCKIVVRLNKQSSDIAIGVEKQGNNGATVFGAGDQGIVFGYACRQTSVFLPAPIFYAHCLAKRIDYVYKSGLIPYLGPDGKTQVTFKFVDGVPVAIDTIVISVQHLEDVDYSTLVDDIKEKVIFIESPSNFITNQTKLLINPTGRFVIGGPVADCGLTGRKIIVDTYGGFARHGGGAFSGKDPTKVDRSGAYMARYMAKNVVAAGLAEQCEVQLAFAIGVSKPVSIFVDSFNSSKFSNLELKKALDFCFDLQLNSIIKNLNLLNLHYEKAACYGHFGRLDVNFPWEETDRVDFLKNYFGLV